MEFWRKNDISVRRVKTKRMSKEKSGTTPIANYTTVIEPVSCMESTILGGYGVKTPP